MAIYQEAGIDAVREKSLRLTNFLMEAVEAAGLLGPDYGFAIGSPREDARRGGHVAVEHASAAAIARALKNRGIVPDFRHPNVIRIAPVALYVSFEEVWQTVDTLRQIVEAGEHRGAEQGRELVA
jgi:kynureninase